MPNELVLIRLHLRHYALAPIAEHEQRDMQGMVIDSSLIKDLLGEVHRWGFELNEHERLHLSVINNGIATLLYACHLYRHFYGNKVVRITELIYEEL